MPETRDPGGVDPGRPHPIMIVEDDADSREALRLALEEEGFPVVEAANGRDALDMMATGVEPCVVFLDLMMPVMSGLEFIAELRKDPKREGTPVVLVSAWPSEATRTPGAQGFMRKPFDLAELFENARRYCPRPQCDEQERRDTRPSEQPEGHP